MGGGGLPRVGEGLGVAGVDVTGGVGVVEGASAVVAVGEGD